jgi:hypothetical protein
VVYWGEETAFWAGVVEDSWLKHGLHFSISLAD